MNLQLRIGSGIRRSVVIQFGVNSIEDRIRNKRTYKEQVMKRVALSMIGSALIVASSLEAQTDRMGNVTPALDSQVVSTCANLVRNRLGHTGGDQYRRSMQICMTETHNDKNVRLAEERIAAAQLARQYALTVSLLRYDAALYLVHARERMESIIGAEDTRLLIADLREPGQMQGANVRRARAIGIDTGAYERLRHALSAQGKAENREDSAKNAIARYLLSKGPHIEKISDDRKREILDESRRARAALSDLLEPSGEVGSVMQQWQDRRDAIPEIAEAITSFSALREDVADRLAIERAIAFEIVERAARTVDF